tara:strand:- start:748 stop:984 length:237 start_codon:yes stop_codon:yes gene_type:complete
MKLYRINTGDGCHYARNRQHLKRAIKHIDKNVRRKEHLTVETVELDITREGILRAIIEGCEAAGGHPQAHVLFFGDGD